MANDGTIKIGTLLDQSGLKSGLAGIGGLAEKGFSVLKTSAKVAASAIAGVGAGVVAIGTASVAVGKDFESSLAKASTLFGDVAADTGI